MHATWALVRAGTAFLVLATFGGCGRTNSRDLADASVGGTTGSTGGTTGSTGGATGSTGGATGSTGGTAGPGDTAGGASVVGGTSAIGGTTSAPLQCSNSDGLQVVSVVAGRLHTCVLMSNGGVRCWGDNEFGQLGDGTTTQHSTIPTTDVLTGVRFIAAGGGYTYADGASGYTCAVMSNGGLRCWGDNRLGQLGNGTATSSSTPPTSDVLTGVRAIAAGFKHTCALMETGGVRCWGYNKFGQLGDGTTTNRSTPPTSDMLTGVKAIATGYAHTCALMETGSMRCWGYNAYGQLGVGSNPDCTDYSYAGSGVFVEVSVPCDRSPPTGDTLTGVQAIATGFNYTCTLMSSGGVRCWGYNGSGQLGDGTTTNSSTPPTSDVLTGVKAISAGDVHTCALMDMGGVRCWGHNGSGQLGDGTTTNSSTPPTSDVLAGVKAIAVGGAGGSVVYGHTCALMDAGGVRCWGNNYYGQLGDGSGLRQTSPTQVVGTCE